MSHSKAVNVKILSKEFQIHCPNGAEEHLLEAVEYLDLKMNEIHKKGRVVGMERIAITAALNIIHELLAFKKQKETYIQAVIEHITCLQNKIDSVLTR